MTERSYDELADEHRAKMLARLPEMLGRLDWDTETLRAHRNESLAEILKFASANSAWHAERLATCDLGLVDAEHLDSLPVMTKPDVMKNWDRIVTDRRLSLAMASAHTKALENGPAYLLDEYHVFTTGGTTGEPSVFCLSSDEMGISLGSGIRAALKRGLLPQRTAWCAARSYSHGSVGYSRWMGGPAAALLLVPVDQPIAQIVEKLNEIQPDSLFTLGSMVGPLAAAAQSGDLRISISMLSTGGDVLPPEQADAAEQAFGVRPSETYPTTDVGTIASRIGDEREMIVNDDLLIVECVDEDDRPVPVGTPSDHILVTSFYQRTLPMIRYRMDDRLTLSQPPSANAPMKPLVSSAFTRVGCVDGRSDEILHYGSVSIHPHAFRTVLAHCPAVTEYQVTQTTRGAEVAVVAQPDIDLDALSADLSARLEAAGLSDPIVNVRRHDCLPRTKMGKRRLFVPLSAQA